jgi:hypothetical protein
MEHSLYWFGSIQFRYGFTRMTDRNMTRQYLEDYAVGQVYRSGRLRVDRDQLIAFAAHSIRNLITSTKRPRANRCFAGSRRAVGILRR